jgi:methionyl aminopeptidase
VNSIEIKSRKDLDTMDRANRIVRTILAEMAEMVRPGITTGELDRYAERRLAEENALPAFKGYHDFPACLCTSINEEVVHGIPNDGRVLREGDLLSLDFGAIVDGLYADAAVTVAVGKASAEAAELNRVTRESLVRAIEQVRPGNRVSDISAAVQTYVESHGYSIVREFVGHGIGRRLHEEPQVPNYVAGGPDPRLREGLVLAIEPMVAMGDAAVEVDREDHWTARTRDRSLSAHWELSVAVTANGPWVLGEPVAVGAAVPAGSARPEGGASR